MLGPGAKAKGGAQVASDYFLKLDGIKGESKDFKHKDEIDLISFSWGLLNAGGGRGGGGGAGKADFEDLHVVSRLSRASPSLFLACASGQHLKSGLLTARKAGGSPLEYLKFKLTDVLVSSYHLAAEDDEGGDTPLEEVSFNYAKLEFTYSPQKEDGSLDSAVGASWDLKANKKV
jgi:type VI secretion system secreted protein Hcp